MMPNIICSAVTNEIKILRSRFIATLYPVHNVTEIRSTLLQHNHEYSDATHNCYAYVLGSNKETTYYADAGEPSGTAGKPILNELLRHDLSDVLAVVTRYYGGIKLGVKGLIEAYGNAVAEAIANAETRILVDMYSYHVECDYAIFEILKHKTAELEGELGNVTFADTVCLDVSIPKHLRGELCDFLDGLAGQNYLHYLARKDV